jgi:hypothetical protein
MSLPTQKQPICAGSPKAVRLDVALRPGVPRRFRRGGVSGEKAVPERACMKPMALQNGVDA